MKAFFCLLFLVPSLLGASEKPNVIYILADDLGLGDLSIYGQEKIETPNIDRLGKEGLVFHAHYSGNTVCTPSRANLMTGQHPGNVYVRGNLKGEVGAALDPAMTVLPEVFKAAGYVTGAFGKWGLGVTNEEGAENPLSHGFDTFCGWKSQTIAHTYYPSTYVEDGEELPLEEGRYLHDLVMGRAMDFIQRSAEAEERFFCYIPTAVPHAAMHAPKELHEKWRSVFPEFDNRIGKYSAGGEPCPDVINPIAGFAAMMENLDDQIGEILTLLEEIGIDEDTMIVFTSDNGTHKEGGHDPKFWNSSAGLRGYKRDMHEGGIRTPMLVRWPGTIATGQESDHLSAFWDVLPTMCDVIGEPVPEQSDGLSFLPTLLGESTDQEEHEYLYWEFCKGAEQTVFSQAVRKGDWKAYREKAKPIQIFNLAEDPFEQSDLAEERPDLVGEMEAIMTQTHIPLSHEP